MKTKKPASKKTKAEHIDELAKAEARLAELEEQRIEGDDVFRRLYADSPIMLHSVDVNGVLVNVSNYWLDTLGYDREEVIGRPLGDFFTPASRELDAIEGLPRFIETGIARDEPRQMLTKNGEVLDILLSANAEYDADGRFLFSRAVVKNITAERTAEEALRKSEQFYSTVTRLSPAGIFRSGTDGGCEYVNERWCEIYDMDFADALGDGWSRALHPHDMGEILDKWENAARGNEPYEAEYRVRGRDGSTRWVHFQAIIENNEIGQPVGHIGAVTDITERRSAERTLDRQRILLEAVFRDVPDAMVLANTNREIIMCNAGLSEIFGYTEDEILGQQTSVLYQSAEEFEAQGKKRFNLSAEEQREPYVMSYRRKDGTLFSGETIGTPVRDQEGNTLGFLGLIRDISDRLEAERLLAENEARFRDFGAAAADWYWEMDENLRFSYFSEHFERFTGVAPHALLGKTRRETGIPGVDKEAWEQHLDDLDNHKPFRNFVHSRVMKDGSSVHVSISALPLFDEDETFKGYRGIGTDITEMVAFEEMAAEEKARLLDAIESMDGGVLLLDKDDRFVLCNTQYRSILNTLSDVLVPGTTFEEIIRAVTENKMITDSLDDPETYIRDRMERHRRRETTVLHNRELDRWIMLREYATSDGGTFLVRTDITDRMQAEEGLRQSEERFRRIFEDAAAGMYVFDLERRFCQVNEAFCRYVGYTEDELLKMSITDFSPAGHQDEYSPISQVTLIFHATTI